jgi:hypothetical protein
MIKRYIKKKVLLILHLLRKIITFFKKTYVFIIKNITPKNDFVMPGGKSTYCYDKFKEDELKLCYENFKPHFLKSVFLDKNLMKEFAIKRALKNDSDANNQYNYLEFGVGRGTSSKIFLKHLEKKKLYGFDSFVGLKEDWVGQNYTANSLSQKGIVPKLGPNFFPIQGWIQDTLPEFLKKNPKKINFIHVDCDTYETTKFILSNLKPYLIKGCVILFNENEYKYLAFSYNKNNVTIQLV